MGNNVNVQNVSVSLEELQATAQFSIVDEQGLNVHEHSIKKIGKICENLRTSGKDDPPRRARRTRREAIPISDL